MSRILSTIVMFLGCLPAQAVDMQRIADQVIGHYRCVGNTESLAGYQLEQRKESGAWTVLQFFANPVWQEGDLQTGFLEAERQCQNGLVLHASKRCESIVKYNYHSGRLPVFAMNMEEFKDIVDHSRLPDRIKKFVFTALEKKSSLVYALPDYENSQTYYAVADAQTCNVLWYGSIKSGSQAASR